MRHTAKKIWLLLVPILLACGLAGAQQRFPPPEFENGYQLPVTATPQGRSPALQYLDVAVLAACLGLAVWLIYRQRSRRGLFWLSMFSLGYFGFYRKGCICPIGSPQNITYGLFHSDYAVPVTVIAFFALPLLVALFAGRAFCAGVCPQGALQDFFLIKPVKVPVWLENGLSIIPYLFLGAGIAYAATGTGFVICRYDPFVPLFRLSGSFFILSAGVSFVILGMFVGRPYCRFLCPYGALLKLTALVSKWRVRVTPDYCTQCQLCQNSCPFGAMREPSAAGPPQNIGAERRRLGWLLALLPALIAAGVWAGAGLSPVAARLHPTVALANLHARQQVHPVTYGALTPEALALARAEQQPEVLLATAADLRVRFRLATMLFGGWFGLVVGVKLIALSLRQSRADYEPDRGACFACARCFSACPNERVRLGEVPPPAVLSVPSVVLVPSGK
jgi:ferredoxin